MKKGDRLPNGYIVGRGREPLNLTEAQIRYAMKNSKSNSGASRFLNISLTTYEKYSKMYIDEESGKTLWDIQKNQKGVGISKGQNILRGKYALVDILEGKYPEYSVYHLKNRLVRNGHKFNFSCNCHNCGYDERRITDNTLPIVLDHINDDWHDHTLENLRFLCYNCFHNIKANLRGSQPRWRVEDIKKAKETRERNKEQTK